MSLKNIFVKIIRSVLFSAAIFGCVSSKSSNINEAHASEVTKSLATIDALNYQGSFRLPGDTFGESSVNYSSGAIGFNTDNKSLFIAGHTLESSVAEFPIPALINSTDINALNIANAPIQDFVDVLHKAPIDEGQGIRINGLYQKNGKLLINIYRFYDHSIPANQQTTLVVTNSDNLLAAPVDGYLKMEGAAKAAGWITPIPIIWQSILGGTHISGFSSSTNRAIFYNGSVGPSAYVFNADDVVNNSRELTDIPTTELLSYSLENGLVDSADLYNGSLTNKTWTHASEASFGLILPGTSTYLVLGMSGGHINGMDYGNPPYGGYKGHYTIDQHDKHPYYWLYDVNDLVDAKNGVINPYDIRPYSVGNFDVPFQTNIVNAVSGGTYDPASRSIYLSVQSADEAKPVIVVYTLDGEK